MARSPTIRPTHRALPEANSSGDPAWQIDQMDEALLDADPFCDALFAELKRRTINEGLRISKPVG